jgi:tetratricopeptide (TPR) repeat protein
LALAGTPALASPSAAKTPSVPAVEPAPFASSVSVKAISSVAAPPGGCASRANTGPRAALECYLNQAGGSDLGAQVALYEAARLYRDALGDAGHAITTLRELRRRFPDGALAVEAELSLAELLPKLGKYREALDASTAALESHPARERADELHLLRGELLRAGLGDCARAETEYAAADNASHDSVADPAAFGRALCLEKLGRGAAAREAFQRYLVRPQARRAGEAARHLHELDRAPL